MTAFAHPSQIIGVGAHRCSRRATFAIVRPVHAPAGARGEVDEIASVSTVSIASALAERLKSSAPPAA